jgi:hypothetical protein
MTIRDEWQEFHADPLLKAEKNLQMVLLDLGAPFRNDFYKEGTGPDKGSGILMPEGDDNPEIQVIDESGNTFNLVYAGARRTFLPVYDLPYPNKWARDRGYKTIRIRSSRPIKCKAIYWFCDSVKDWP